MIRGLETDFVLFAVHCRPQLPYGFREETELLLQGGDLHLLKGHVAKQGVRLAIEVVLATVHELALDGGEEGIDPLVHFGKMLELLLRQFAETLHLEKLALGKADFVVVVVVRHSVHNRSFSLSGRIALEDFFLQLSRPKVEPLPFDHFPKTDS